MRNKPTKTAIVKTLEDALELTPETTAELHVESPGDAIEAVEAEPTIEVEVESDIVSDNGVQMYKRMKPTYAPAPIAQKPRTAPSYKAPTKQMQYEVSANPALLAFPTDRYGITKDIRKAMISTASRIAGDANKKDLVLQVMKILLEHIELKFVADNQYKLKIAARDAAKNRV
jgi:hypothetical protein